MAARRFAEDTKVQVDKSQADVKALLKKAGATETAVYEAVGRSMIAFTLGDYSYRLSAPVPTLKSTAASAQEERRVWRVLHLLVKAKLEAVASGATTIEREFMSDIIVAPNETMAERVLPELASAKAAGRLPRALMLEGPQS